MFIKYVDNNNGGMLFIYGYGGTRIFFINGDYAMSFIYGYSGTEETYVWRTLSASICSKGHLVLTIASSAIASLLLIGRYTTHSRFLIFINFDEDLVCSIVINTELC